MKRLALALALCAAPAWADYRAVVLKDAPLSYWELNTNSDTTDRGSLGNAISYTGSPPSAAGLLKYDPQSSIDFDGGTQSATAADQPAYTPASAGDTDLTVEAWVNIDTNTGNPAFVIKDSGGNFEWWLDYSGGNAIRYTIFKNTGSVYGQCNVGPALGIGSTFHLVGVFDQTAGTGQSIKCRASSTSAFKVADQTSTSFNAANGWSDTNATVNMSPSGARVNGRIERIAIYGSALTDAQIESHWKHGTGRQPRRRSR